jgi:hypothetical protein
MTKYVLSTMTDSVSYAVYNYVGDTSKEAKVGPLPVVRKKITIFGGAGIPSARSGFGDVTNDAEGSPIWTAAGMVTPVSDENYEILKDHWLFQKHQAAARVKVLNNDITGNHKAVKKEVATMHREDHHAQLTPATVKSRVMVKTPSKQAELDGDGTFRL